MVVVCSLSVLDGYRLFDDPVSYEGIAADFRGSVATPRGLDAEVFLASLRPFSVCEGRCCDWRRRARRLSTPLDSLAICNDQPGLSMRLWRSKVAAAVAKLSDQPYSGGYG